MDEWKARSETWEKFKAINRWCHDDTSKARTKYIFYTGCIEKQIAKFSVDFILLTFRVGVFLFFLVSSRLTAVLYFDSEIPQYRDNDWWNWWGEKSDVIMIFAWFNVIISIALNGNKYL